MPAADPDDRRSTPLTEPSDAGDALTEVQHVLRRIEYLACGIRLRADGAALAHVEVTREAA